MTAGLTNALDDAIAQTESRRDLTRDQAAAAMRAMIDSPTGPDADERTRKLLLALRAKGETPDEIAGFARVMRERAVPVAVDLARFPDLIDVCGTGGDGAATFNISTTVAFVVAAAGVPVAKHGNRAVSSRCGSGDVLEALGIRSELGAQTPEAVLRDLDRYGIGFFFAPAFHPALKRFSDVRRSLKVRTVFNLLGPLANPAGVRKQLVGVFDPSLTETMARTLAELGSTDVLVVSAGGLDELSLSGPTTASRLASGRVTTSLVRPEDAGLQPAPIEKLAGGSPEDNARIIVALLDGEMGPCRDAVLLNAAAALEVAGHARTLPDGVALAAQAIDSGRASKLLKMLRERK